MVCWWAGINQDSLRNISKYEILAKRCQEKKPSLEKTVTILPKLTFGKAFRWMRFLNLQNLLLIVDVGSSLTEAFFVGDKASQIGKLYFFLTIISMFVIPSVSVGQWSRVGKG